DIEKAAFYEEIYNQINRLDNETDEVIVMGDFNCRIGDDLPVEYRSTVGRFVDATETSDNGDRLLDLCHWFGFRLENTFFDKRDIHRHTWYHPGSKKGAVLDFILNRNRKVRVLDVRAGRGADATSDHCLVKLIVRVIAGNASSTRRKYLVRQSDETWSNKDVATQIARDNRQFITELSTRLHSMHNIEDIEKSIIESAKQIPIRSKRRNKLKTLLLTRQIRDAIQLKHKMRRAWLAEQTESTLEQYKEQRKKVRQLFRKAKEDAVDRLATEFDHLMKSNETRQAYTKLDEVLKISTGAWPTARKDIQKISNTTLAEHYKKLFALNSSIRSMQPTTSTTHFEEDLSMVELQLAIKKMKSNKAPGRNRIRSELIKHGGMQLHERLLEIYNQYWRGNLMLPKEWKDAEVISIYKRKGCREDPNNYRSIFLLDVIGKIYASMVCSRLLTYSDRCMSSSQMGFRKDLSTDQAILAVRYLIQNARDQRAPLILVFVDLTKAFDSIPREEVRRCLINLHCSTNVMNNILQLMDHPTGYLRGSEDSFTMYRGVRQGSKEGPLVFNIVFNAILNDAFHSTTSGLPMLENQANNQSWQLNHLEYADDLCITSTSTQKAEKVLNTLDVKLKELGMAISYAKTKWMYVGGIPPSNARIEIDGTSIERVESFCYLGSEISSDGDNTSAVKQNVRKARFSLARLRPALRSNNITLRTKTKLINSFIKPVLYYGLSTIVLTKVLHDKMEALLNTARRIILGIRDKRELKVVELKERISLEPPARDLRARRLQLWLSLHKRRDNLALKIVKSRQRKKNGFRKVYTKDWMRQLLGDANDIPNTSPTQWIQHPTPFDKNEININRPKLAGIRERNITCTAKDCERKFATKGAMYQHVRNDHTVSIAHTDKLACPMLNCRKTFRIQGWLRRHIKECHPKIYSTHLASTSNQVPTHIHSSSTATDRHTNRGRKPKQNNYGAP
ncbi:MAG: reverse transcriptase family protein, partial [Candidatus Thiodiazotropha sp.]